MNVLLIGAALWVLLLPPVFQVDGDWTMPDTKNLSEWWRTDYMETYAQCRDRRMARRVELTKAAQWAYSKGMADASKRYYLHSLQYSVGKCWPVDKVEREMRRLGRSQAIYLN